MCFLHREALQIVEPAVVAFADDGIQRWRRATDRGIGRDCVPHHGRIDRADGKRVRQCDRRLEQPELVELDEPCRLAKTVDHDGGRRNRSAIRIARVRTHDRYAGLHAVFGKRGVAYGDARDVGDGVAWTCAEKADLRRFDHGNQWAGRTRRYQDPASEGPV